MLAIAQVLCLSLVCAMLVVHVFHATNSMHVVGCCLCAAELWVVRCLVEGFWATCFVETWPHAQKLVEHVAKHGQPTISKVSAMAV